jgi:hypothetical protein
MGTGGTDGGSTGVIGIDGGRRTNGIDDVMEKRIAILRFVLIVSLIFNAVTLINYTVDKAHFIESVCGHLRNLAMLFESWPLDSDGADYTIAAIERECEQLDTEIGDASSYLNRRIKAPTFYRQKFALS